MTETGIQLARLGQSDTAEAFLVWSDFETVKLTNWSHTPTLDDCAQRMTKVLAHYAQEPRHFGPYVIRLAEGLFVGLIGADLFDPAREEYEAWYILRRDEWNRGIGTRAVAELLHRMGESGRVKRAMATAVTTNVASCKLLERHGFLRERLVPGGFQKHGSTLDLFVYGKEMPCYHPP